METLRKSPPDWRLDRDRIGLWTASSNAPTALRYATRNAKSLRFAVFYYPNLEPPDSVPESLPLLVVRAENDQEQGVNSSIARFERKAPALNARLQVLSHPGGHAFDVSDASAESTDTIRATLRFMRQSAGLEP